MKEALSPTYLIDFLIKDSDRIKDKLNQQIDVPATGEIVLNTRRVCITVPKESFVENYKLIVAALMEKIFFLRQCGAKIVCSKVEVIVDHDGIFGNSFYLKATLVKEK